MSGFSDVAASGVPDEQSAAAERRRRSSSTSGHSSTISSPTVPAPAMIRSSSNGGMTAAPVFSAISRATVSRVAEVTPAVTTSAP